MRIAIVSTILSYPWGGADTLWTRAAEAARARGDTLLLAVTEAVAGHDRVERLRREGAAVCLRPPPAPPRLVDRVQRKLGREPRRDAPLISALAGFAPELVIINCGGTFDLLLEAELRGWLRESGTAYRVIANWQKENPWLESSDRTAARCFLQEAEQAFFVSTRNLASTRRLLLDPLPRARVLHNPLRSEGTVPLPWPDETRWRFATVSRLTHDKGIHLLIHALAAALAGESGWELHVFGSGPDDDYLRETSRALGLDRHVQFRGHVPRLDDLYGGIHLMVSPAVDDGVPMTIPEALFCARPALATAVGGAEDWIEPGRNGFLCTAATHPILTETLRAAWAVRTSWRDLGIQGAALAAGRYRPNDYLQLIGRSAPLAPPSGAS